MKRKKKPVLVVLLLILLVAAAGLITLLIQMRTPSDQHMDSARYYGVTQEDQAALVVNGTVSETTGKLIDGTVYIDYDSVHNFINKRFYWDKNENLMLYALPDEVVEIDLSRENPDCRVLDGQLYLSADIIQQYTDMEYTALEGPSRLVIRNQWDGIRTADVTEDTQVRYRGGIKSDILTEVTAGTKLQVMEDSYENWIQVTTDDGYTGFIEKSCLGQIAEEEENKHVSQMPEYTSLTRDKKINMVWHQTTSQDANKAITEMIKGVKGVNVIAPTWYFINDTKGGLLNLASKSYVEAAHAMKMEVWAVINDFDGNISSNKDTLAALSSTANRKKMIKTLMESVLANKIDGINVDLEKVSEECAPHYLQFIRELSVSCRKEGIVLSVDNYVPKNYSTYFDREEQGIVADYVVIMGYDEHFSGSEEAGSVASHSFVEEGIKRTLEEVPAKKVINAIPFYTRIWTTDSSGVVSSATYGMDKADAFVAEKGMDKYWDKETSQNYAEIQDGNDFYQVWLEDEQSIEDKMKMIRFYELAGVAEWKLGFERAAIWDVISKYLS